MRASLDWLSGRLKGDLKRRALLLRSRSIPPSRSMSTAVHGCWGYGGTRVLGRPHTVPTVRVGTVHELSKAGADARCVWRRNNAIAREHTVSQPVTRSVSRPLIDSTVFRPSPTSLAIFTCTYSLSRVYRCLSSRNLQQIRPKNKTTKKRSTFQRALARVRESTQWPGLGVLIACPALPAIDREMPMSMSNPSRGPGAAEPLYSLVLPCVYSMCCGLW